MMTANLTSLTSRDSHDPPCLPASRFYGARSQGVAGENVKILSAVASYMVSDVLCEFCGWCACICYIVPICQTGG